MIVLKRLTWNNLFSYGSNNSINLAEHPITQLIGLNGHGKSSIPLILEEVLFNKNSKGVKKADLVNRNLDTNKYDIALDFEVFNDVYKLTVSRAGSAQKVKLIKNEEDISSHTATDTFKQVEQIIGLDFKTFSQIVYQNSSSSLQFLVATDAARKAFLIELLSLEKYVEIFEQVKEIHKDTSDSLNNAKTKVETIKSWISKNKLQSQTKLEITEPPDLDDGILAELTDKTASLQGIESLNKRILKNNEYKSILAGLDKTKLTHGLKKLDTTSITKTLAVLKHKLDAEKARAARFSGVTEGECPTCYQPVNLEIIDRLLEEAKTAAAKFNEEIKSAKEELRLAEENNAKLEAHDKIIADFEKFSNLIDETLPQDSLDKAELLAEISQLNAEVQKIQAAIKKVNSDNQAAVVHNAKIDSIIEQTKKFTEELMELETQLQQLEENFGLLEVMKKAFSTTGLLAYKIENSVKDLESLTNEYLAELSDGRFQLEFVLEKDKLKVAIIDNGSTIEITALSAGELARVTTSTLLAIRKLMSSLSKCRLNVLFLDETIDNLDTYGKERLVEVLLNEPYLNTFIISHGYSHPLIEKITVVKENDISRLEV